jgi:hypothetical protein
MRAGLDRVGASSCPRSLASLPQSDRDVILGKTAQTSTPC